MSRFAVASALVLSLFSSVAHADQLYVPGAAPHFARAPQMTEQELPPDLAPARTLDRDTVRAALVARRAQNLASFRAYQKAGTFPSNTYEDRVLNVWRDEAGHLCAAATIINLAGQTELVKRVAEQTNFIKLGDVTTGPLMDWILTSGFTQDEIALIQRPYMPVSRKPTPIHEQPIMAGAGSRRMIDARLRTAETARLAKLYKQIDAKLVKDERASIERAVTRLMKKPALAWQLIDAV
jgi:hypothetical protein